MGLEFGEAIKHARKTRPRQSPGTFSSPPTTSPIPLILHTNPTILRLQKLLNRPRLILIARNTVGVHKRLLPSEQVLRASVIVRVRVFLWVMLKNPVADHFSHDLGVAGHGVPVGFVVELSVLEACLLGAGDALESVFSVGKRGFVNFRCERRRGTNGLQLRLLAWLSSASQCCVGMGKTYLNLLCTFAANPTSSRPATCKHAARENASSIAIVPPLADVGRNG
jgi:hypothetical protein